MTTLLAESPYAVEDSAVLLRRHLQVLDMLASGRPLEQILAAIIGSLEGLVPGIRCSILLVDADRRVLRHGSAPSLPEWYVKAIDGIALGPLAGSCGTAAYRNRPVIAADVQTDRRWERYRAIAGQAGLRSCWSLPIRGSHGKPVGTFAVYRPEVHRPARRERAVVQGFTHLAAVAIEHVRLIDDLVETEERFRRSFDDNAMGMLIVGVDRKVERSNRAFAEMVGCRASRLAGVELGSLVVPEERWRVQRRLEQFVIGAIDKLTVETSLLRSDMTALPSEATFSLLRSPSGSPAHLSVSWLDLTERRATERERRARLEAEVARRTAEEHSRAKSALLREVGHEVRTPIQTITGFAELLRTLDLDEAQQTEALEGITAAAGHVLALLNDVLEMSRIEAGALTVELEAVDLAAVTVEVLELLAPQTRSRKVRIDNRVSAIPAVADRRRLRQILLNLIGNAIRYGTVVELDAVAEGGVVLLTVADDGPGVPTEFLPRLFAPFERLGDPSESQTGIEGFGLGLALAKGLATTMGGDLTASSANGSGTRMTGTRLTGTRLTGTRLTGTRMTGTRMTVTLNRPPAIGRRCGEDNNT